MNLEEAVEKYGIHVPTDEEFYSKGYMDYFNRNVKAEGLRKKFEKYSEFNIMYKKSEYATFHKYINEIINNSDSLVNYEAVVLGGQAGAGKGSLSSLAIREFDKKGKSIILIDDDQYRKFYPKEKREAILKECPEFYTKLTALGSSSITPKIMKYASDRGINFIFDGTLKNKRIIQTAMNWKNYDVNWKIMATSKLESLISVFERNKKLKNEGDCRFLTVDVHNETYLGIEDTLMFLESMDDIGKIQVYSRGEVEENPVLVYDSFEKNGKYRTAVAALRETRKEDKKRTIRRGVSPRLTELKRTKNPWNNAELNALKEMEERVKCEVELDEER